MQYDGNSVSVDGRNVKTMVYGQTIAAASEFKYLGVVMDSRCNHAAHATARMLAVGRSAHLLSAGLSKIPSYPCRLLTYLLSRLVAPVANYGMDLFAYTDAERHASEAKERMWAILASWRRIS